MILWLWLWHVWLTCDITLNSNSRFSNKKINEMKKRNENKLLLNLISNVQQWYTNQHSLPSWTSFIHLKLWPCSRQTVQYISWSQDHSTSLHHQAQSLHTLCTSRSILWTFISQCEPYLIAVYCYDRHLLVKACTRVKGMTMWSAVPHVVSVSTSCSRCCYLTLFLWSPCVVLLIYASLFYYGLVYIA